jgi:DNA-binding Lrp family transcriptional regulator
MTTRKTTLESPVRRTKGLSERSLDTELLLHDIDSDQVTALDAEATAVWRLCDGSHSIDELATETGQSVEEVAGRLATLDDAGLLERVGMNRRTLLLRAGAVGVAVPVVSMLNLPAAAAANSVLAQTTTFSCSNGTIAGTNNHLIVTTHLTGGLANTTYNMYVYTSATLSVASLVSPTPAAGVNTNGAGAASCRVEALFISRSPKERAAPQPTRCSRWSYRRPPRSTAPPPRAELVPPARRM